MKKSALALLVTLNFSAHANAEGWLDSLKNLVGLGDTTEQTSTASTTVMGIASRVICRIGTSGGFCSKLLS